MPYLGSKPADKALEADDIAANAVTTAKIADDAVDRDKINLVSTSSVPSLEAKGDGSSQDGYIQLNCSQNSHGIKLKSPPHSAGQSYTLTYPSSIVNNGFMKTDSSGNLSFATDAGGLNHLSTATASSSASLDFTSIITSTYDVYLIVLDEIMPATNAADLYLLLSGDNGSSFITADYAYVTDTLTKHNHGDSVTRSSTSARGLAQIQLMNSAATNQGAGISGPIYLFSPLSTTVQPSLRWSFIGNDNGVNLKVLDGAAKEETSSARDAFQIKFSSGNIASGTVRVYGLANS